MRGWLCTLIWAACTWAALPGHAAPGGGSAVFGVVPAESSAAEGLEVAAVAPGSPAERFGLRAGDIICAVDGAAIRTRSDLLAAILPHNPGDCVAVRYLRDGAAAEAQVRLDARRKSKRKAPDTTDPGYREHGDTMVKTLDIPADIRRNMRALKRQIRHSLAALPDDFAPEAVSDKLQQLRDLARDAQAHRHGWMVGRACEAYLQFRDAEGTLVLHGANNRLTLEVYSPDGRLLYKAPLNTPEERKALPPALLDRLRKLKS